MTDVDKANKSYPCEIFFLLVCFYACVQLKPLQQRNDYLLDYRKTNSDARVHKKSILSHTNHKPASHRQIIIGISSAGDHKLHTTSLKPSWNCYLLHDFSQRSYLYIHMPPYIRSPHHRKKQMSKSVTINEPGAECKELLSGITTNDGMCVHYQATHTV